MKTVLFNGYLTTRECAMLWANENNGNNGNNGMVYVQRLSKTRSPDFSVPLCLCG